MPELPEVETVVRTLKPWLERRIIARIEPENGFVKVLSGGTPQSFNRQVAGKTIRAVTRRGKFIILKLSRGYLLIHLRMTGRLLVRLGPDDKPQPLTATIHFSDGKKLYFKDYRKFGRLCYHDSLDTLETRLGLEPLSDQFTAEWLLTNLKTHQRQIKPLLLDQSFIAGLGNIYVDEGLWAAQIHPAMPANRIESKQIKDLRRAIRHILRESIKKNGTTIINFQFGEGNTGEFVNDLQVFDRTGQPCPRCGTAIIKTRLAQRGTHLCPHCQTLPE